MKTALEKAVADLAAAELDLESETEFTEDQSLVTTAE